MILFMGFFFFLGQTSNTIWTWANIEICWAQIDLFENPTFQLTKVNGGKKNTPKYVFN